MSRRASSGMKRVAVFVLFGSALLVLAFGPARSGDPACAFEEAGCTEAELARIDADRSDDARRTLMAVAVSAVLVAGGVAVAVLGRDRTLGAAPLPPPPGATS